MPSSSGQRPPSVHVSVLIPSEVEAAMRRTMNEQGVSPRKKSRWVAGALAELLTMDAKAILDDGVLSGKSLQAGGKTGKLHVLTVDEDLQLALVSKVGELRQRDPYADASQAALVRAAILNKVGQV